MVTNFTSTTNVYYGKTGNSTISEYFAQCDMSTKLVHIFLPVMWYGEFRLGIP